MQFTYPPEAEELRAELRAWLTENLTDDFRNHGPQAMFGGGGARPDLINARAWSRSLYEGGWACIEWPREHGGRAATAAQQIVFAEEMQAGWGAWASRSARHHPHRSGHRHIQH